VEVAFHFHQRRWGDGGSVTRDPPFGLAVPEYAYEAGVKTFADLDPHADKFSRKI